MQKLTDELQFCMNGVSLQAILSNLLAAIDEIQCVYVFGSYASGKTSAQSDLDIAFWAEKQVPAIELFYLQEKLASMCLIDIDLIQMRTSTEVFRFEIITTGKRVYAVDMPTVDNIENKIWNDYLYLNEVRKHIINDKLGRVVL